MLQVARKEKELREERIKWKKQMSSPPVVGGAMKLPKPRRSSSLSEGNPESPLMSPGISEEEDVEMMYKGEVTTLKIINTVGGNSLGGWVHLGKVCGKVVAISEWVFPTSVKVTKKTVHDSQILIKQISSIEQELSALQKLPNHPNVVPYVGLCLQKPKHRLRLLILEEFVFGSNLAFFLSENVPMDLDLLRHYIQGILAALDFMHGHNFVHRDLR